MVKHDLDEQGWRKAGTCSYDDCVELQGVVGGVAVRDSALPDGPVLAIGRGAFRDLVTQVKGRPVR